MLRYINKLLSSIDWEIRKLPDKKRRRAVVSLQSPGQARGNALLSYIPEVFTESNANELKHQHTHYWECARIANSYLQKGFNVDVIHYADERFVPKKQYDILVSARTNLERLSKKLPASCLKIAHLDTAHYLTNNANAFRRLEETRERRGISLRNLRMIEENWAIEHADMGCVLGNEFTASTYQFANKPIHRIPISCTDTFDWPANKDFEEARKRFLWFGSGGFVHKGLDLALEAFKAMPDLSLVVCGPTDSEKRFDVAFKDELYTTPNIDTRGWTDVTSSEFSTICNQTIATVYPSCAEGGGGSVLTCMHAGLIPVVTREASVDVSDFGIVLESGSINDIQTAAQQLSAMPIETLESRALAAWEYARANHTQATFAEAYDQFVETVVFPEWEKRQR